MIKLVGQCVGDKPPVGLGWDKTLVKPAAVQAAISNAKNRRLDAAAYAAEDGRDPRVARVSAGVRRRSVKTTKRRSRGRSSRSTRPRSCGGTRSTSTTCSR